MTPEQVIAIESRVTNEGKSQLLGFVLWFFLGVFGGHRFYLNKSGGLIQLSGFIICIIIYSIGDANTYTVWGVTKHSPLLFVGAIGMIIFAGWAAIDAFSILNWIKEANDKLREKIKTEMNITPNMNSNYSALKKEGSLDDDSYKIYLTKKYNIEFNQALSKYIVVDKLFETIDSALKHADELNNSEIKNNNNSDKNNNGNMNWGNLTEQEEMLIKKYSKNYS